MRLVEHFADLPNVRLYDFLTVNLIVDDLANFKGRGLPINRYILEAICDDRHRVGPTACRRGTHGPSTLPIATISASQRSFCDLPFRGSRNALRRPRCRNAVIKAYKGQIDVRHCRFCCT